MLAVGLMSGTSLDGIDAALVDIEPRNGGYAVLARATRTQPFAPEFAARLRAAVAPGIPTPSEVASLDVELGALFGDAVRNVAGEAQLDFIASHGLTLFHDGDRHITWQIGDPFVIRERSAATVLFDFRRGDCAAGGHGAPLVPFADALLFASPQTFRVALNLGGIANLTLLPPGASTMDVLAWDVGPANMLLDGFVRRRTAGAQTCDRDGRFAAAGTVDRGVLEILLSDAYFAQPAPKSTGRERFGEAFLGTLSRALDGLSVEDGCATLVALTAQTVAAAIQPHARSGEVVVSGGGVHNPALLHALRERLPDFGILSSERLGVDPDFKEAIAFAVLGYELLRGRPAGLPRVTGAGRAALLGAIAPLRLDALLDRLREELDAHAGHRT